MKIFTYKRALTVLCGAFFAAAICQSCGSDTGSLSEKEIADLQSQLDSTMKLYLETKEQNEGFDKQMASRDSAITAQAAEIQSLINQLNSKGKQPVTTSSDAERQQKVIREKENTIKQLQKQLDQQTKQINTLKASSTNGNKEGDSQYKTRIAQLQKQIAEQEKQINDLKKDTGKKNAANCDQMKKSYDEQVADLNGEIKNYKMQIADLHKEIKSLKSDVSKLSNASKSDDAAAEELKSARLELRQMTQQLNECRKLNTQYQNDVKAAKDNLASTQADLEASKSQLKALQASQSDGSKAEQSLRSELASLAEKEAACRAKNDEMTKAQKALVQECENDKQALQATISDLRQQVMAFQTRVDQLTSENAALTKSASSKQQNEADAEATANVIADLSARVESQRLQIEQLQNDLKQKDAELEAAKSNSKSTTKPTKGNIDQKLAELQALCDSYVEEIERLRAENQTLRVENAELKDKVSSSANLFAENERLQQKVKMASVLVTTDLVATPGKSVKIGNVVKPTTKASQTKCIRLDCRIIDNNVVDPGTVTIYARISDASDRAIYNGDASSYSFDLNGVSMQYTAKQEIEFTGSGRALTMLWKKSDNVELKPGLYWVKLYANGYEIGKASFKLN